MDRGIDERQSTVAQQVQGAVAYLFAEFHRTGSAVGVMRAFADTGRLFPQRAWGGAWAGI
ncbi:hypothetical protein [Plantactinospora sp. GCM10030261]|uniref:hypothetical protein n=1 Tax=Plantactinospora sp. GCM10030261 TaxID=3273420 RepID=UPI0036227665